jgi:hypothetical protein
MNPFVYEVPGMRIHLGQVRSGQVTRDAFGLRTSKAGERQRWAVRSAALEGFGDCALIG